MKKVVIEIEAKFGSKFQEKFARDTIFSALLAIRGYLNSSHQKNEVQIKINGNNIKDLDWFNWQD